MNSFQALSHYLRNYLENVEKLLTRIFSFHFEIDIFGFRFLALKRVEAHNATIITVSEDSKREKNGKKSSRTNFCVIDQQKNVETFQIRISLGHCLSA